MTDPHDDAMIRALAAARPPLAADDLSAAGERGSAILTRVLAGDAAPEPGAGRSSPRGAPRWGRRSRPGLVLAGALASVVIVLGAAGVFSGSGGGGTPIADARVLRGVAAALTPKPGTIVIQKMAIAGSHDGRTVRWTLEQAWETPKGAGPQNSLYVTTEHISPPQSAVTNGHQQVYLPSTNTIYDDSVFGADITPGTRPGTYVYTAPAVKNDPEPRPAPITLTAAQARGLRDGSLSVHTIPLGTSPTSRARLVVVPVAHVPSEVASARDLLRQHLLRVVGPVTVDGRAAIELAAPKYSERALARNGDAGDTLYVDPKTYVPIKEVLDRRPLFRNIITYLEYRTLPITTANERLLSLRALHPDATIDHRPADYAHAANGDAVFTG